MPVKLVLDVRSHSGHFCPEACGDALSDFNGEKVWEIPENRQKLVLQLKLRMLQGSELGVTYSKPLTLCPRNTAFIGKPKKHWKP